MILVVDDDPLVRAAIVRAVSELGYSAGEADSGFAALAAVRDYGYDLVILDFLMPGLDGAETARELAALEPDLPILFSTGHAALRALRAEAGDEVRVLEKPFTLDELEALLREHIGERRRARTA